MAEADWSEILSCGAVKSFWIHWDKHGGLFVGRGAVVGDDELIKYRDDSPYQINAFSMSTVGHDGQWTFGIDQGRPTVLISPST